MTLNSFLRSAVATFVDLEVVKIDRGSPRRQDAFLLCLSVSKHDSECYLEKVAWFYMQNESCVWGVA